MGGRVPHVCGRRRLEMLPTRLFQLRRRKTERTGTRVGCDRKRLSETRRVESRPPSGSWGGRTHLMRVRIFALVDIFYCAFATALPPQDLGQVGWVYIGDTWMYQVRPSRAH